MSYKKFDPIYFIIFCCLCIYGQLIIDDPILRNRDDVPILSSLLEVDSLTSYLDVIQSLKKADIQPLTDLTFFIDIKLNELGFRTFHLTNFLVWISILFGARSLIRKFVENKRVVNLSLAFIAFSPVAVMSVSWISARKHLLGVLFLVYFLKTCIDYIDQKKNKLLIKVSLIYLGCLATHLLYAFSIILIPLLFKVRKKRINPGDWIFGFSWSGIFAGWSVYNYYRYLDFYQFNNVGSSEFSVANSLIPEVFISSIGKYFSNLVLLIKPSLSYEPFGLTSIVGLILVFVFLVISHRLGTLTLAWLVLLPIFFVCWKISYLIIDTYLLWPLVISSLVVAIWLEKFKSYSYLFLIPIVINFALSFSLAKKWGNTVALTKMSLNSQGSCTHSAELARLYFAEEKFDLFEKTFTEHRKRNCNSQLDQVLGGYYLVYLDMDLKSKEQIFAKSTSELAIFDLYKAIFYLKASANEKASEYFERYTEKSTKQELLKKNDLIPMLSFLCKERISLVCNRFLEMKQQGFFQIETSEYKILLKRLNRN